MKLQLTSLLNPKNTFALFSLSLALLLGACTKSSKDTSNTSDVRQPSTVEELELGASDLSILVPLQSSIEEDVSVSVFGKSGTGMCNAPTLDLGGEDPIISHAVWQDWAKDTLLSVLPLPTDEKLWNIDGAGGTVAERRSALIEEMRNLPDVDSNDLCPDPIGVNDLVSGDVEALRNAGTHVSAAQTLPAGACRYKNWHVVAARFEPCSLRAKVLQEDANAFDPQINKQFPAEACGGAELRLVLQPFLPRPDGGFASIDMAIHAFYKLDNVPALLDDLRSLRKVTRAELAAKEGEGANAVWYEDNKEMLLPHPGLREEMDCKSQGAEGVGAIGAEWRRLLAKHAKVSRLFKMTWMTSDNSGGNWSFGLRVVQPDMDTSTPRRLVRLEPFKVETFTLSQVARGYPYTPFDMTMNTVDYFYRAGRSDKELGSETAKAAVRELVDIANPDKTTFNLGGKMGASCASCHTRDQTERAVRTRSTKTHAELASLSGTAAWTYPMWDPIAKSIERRNDNNLRNFGYGPAMSISVSRRAANETEALRRVVRDYFRETQILDPAPASEPTADVLTGPIDFNTQVLPTLTASCGYCHASKRAPLLLVERTAQVWASAIVENICKDVDAWQHMPPGKDMPEKDRALIVAWAQSLNPSSEPISCSDYRSLLH